MCLILLWSGLWVEVREDSAERETEREGVADGTRKRAREKGSHLSRFAFARMLGWRSMHLNLSHSFLGLLLRTKQPSYANASSYFPACPVYLDSTRCHRLLSCFPLRARARPLCARAAWESGVSCLCELTALCMCDQCALCQRLHKRIVFSIICVHVNFCDPSMATHQESLFSIICVNVNFCDPSMATDL